MTTTEYLCKVLEREDLPQEEIDALKAKRDEVERFLGEELGDVSHTFKWAGSYAKKRMNGSSYDADLVVYVHNGEEGAGATLDEIYGTVESILKKKYVTVRKSSAIRLLNTGGGEYTHVDVVPGRFFDDTQTDTWLHRTDGDKCRFKTNLKVHLRHIRDSGQQDLVRLVKLWACRNGIACRTFILELMSVDLAPGAASAALPDRVIHVFEQLRDNADDLSVTDPANPTGNDLSGDFGKAKPSLTHFARKSLESIDAGDWASVFGEVEEPDGGKAAALRSVAVHVKPASVPWSDAE